MQMYVLDPLVTELNTGPPSMSPMLQQFLAIGQGYSHHRVAPAHLGTVAMEIQGESLLLLPIT